MKTQINAKLIIIMLKPRKKYATFRFTRFTNTCMSLTDTCMHKEHYNKLFIMTDKQLVILEMSRELQ